MNTLLSISFALFLVMDSMGSIPVYLTVLQKIDSKRRPWIILRELVIALVLILIFAYFGEGFLRVLDISQESIFFAGGIVLFMMGLKMIFPERGSLTDCFGIEGEPIVFPLAVPLIAGPSVLAAVIIYSKELTSFSTLFWAIIIAWIATTLVLLASNLLQTLFGVRGIKALERLMGLILMLIAVNMVIKGVDLHFLLRKT